MNQPADGLAGRYDDLRRLAALLAFALLPILAVFLYAQSGQSYFIVKIFATSSLALPLAIGLAVSRLPVRVVGAACGMILLGLSLTSTWGYFRWEVKEDWRSASRYLNSFDRRGTLVVFLANEGEYLYDYYCHRDGQAPLARTGLPQSFFALNPPRTIQRVKTAHDMDNLDSQLQSGNFGRVLLVLSHTDWSDPAGLARQHLDERFGTGRTHQLDRVDIVEYDTTSGTSGGIEHPKD